MRKVYSTIQTTIRKRPYVISCTVILFYLLVFQNNFVTSGDAWAESYAEYLDESVRLGWSEVIAQNWAGYFSLVPSFIAKAYVALSMPLGYIDIFYRAVVISFSVLTASLFALKLNRILIASDTLRIFLSLATVAILFDVTSFSFINIWYLAFLPLLFIYLSREKLPLKADISLGVLGALISLSKPFLAIIPLIIIRAIRSKQWVGPLIFLFGTALQTFQIIFNDRRQLVESATISLQDTIGGIFTGSGVSLLKLCGIMPASLWVVGVANLVLLGLFTLLWRTRGFWVASTLGAVYLFGVYTYVLAPDFPVYSGIHNFQELYSFTHKSQREIVISGSLIISFFLLIESFAVYMKKNKHTFAPYLPIALSLILLIIIYRPIDTVSAGVSTKPIEPFRQDLNQNLPTCLPLSPTPVFMHDINWLYAHRTKCNAATHDTNIFKPDFNHMNTVPHKARFSFNAAYFGVSESSLGAVVVPVDNKTGEANKLIVKDNKNNRFEASVEPRKGIQFITFNTRGIESRENYNLQFFSERAGIFLGTFTGTPHAIVYLYFLTK
ncbi:MAG TPA: hypothetical protein VFZ58_03030 [Candidatus Saccharimonadales bacterium]